MIYGVIGLLFLCVILLVVLIHEMERTAMEKVSMTNVAGKPSRTERHPSPASPQWETATPGCVDENY